MLLNRSATAKVCAAVIRMVLLLFAVSFVCFLLLSYSPVDPVAAFASDERGASAEYKAAIAARWGFDKTPAQRYFIWLRNALGGDLGESIVYRRPVAQVILERFPASLALMLSAWIISGVLGFALGIVSGKKAGTIFDTITRSFCFVLCSTPVFWIALLALLVFSVYLGWFPLGLAVPIGKSAAEVTLADRLYHLALPALTLSITGVANITLHTRQKLIDMLDSDYALFARARGESDWTLIRRHGLRNIALPAVTLQFSALSEIFGGSVLAETVFSYPGLGSAVSAAGLKGDLPLFLGIAIFSVLFVFAGNVIANILYGILDPRIREGGNFL